MDTELVVALTLTASFMSGPALQPGSPPSTNLFFTPVLGLLL